METVNLIVAGVGGQGSVLGAHIIADAAVRAGLNARVGDTYGAAQRGGKVASHVRIGPDVESPLVPEKGAVAVLGLELLEGLRNVVKYLKAGGVAVISTYEFPPIDASLADLQYPKREEVEEVVRAIASKAFFLDLIQMAKEAGNVRTANVVGIGTLYGLGVLPFDLEYLEEAIKENVPRGTEEVNLRALRIGMEAVR